MFMRLLLVCFLFRSTTCNKKTLNIVGMFEEARMEETYRYAINRVNIDKTFDFRLNLIPIKLNPDDTFVALNSTCRSLKHGIVGILAPTSPSSVNIVREICDAKGIPYILTQWVHSEKVYNSINFFPHPYDLMKAYVDVITSLGWSDVTVLYTDSKSIWELAYLTRSASDISVNLVHLAPSDDNNYWSALIKLRDAALRNFIIHADATDSEDILLNLQQTAMLTENYNYLLTNLDANRLPLRQYSYGTATIIGAELLNFEKVPGTENVVTNNLVPLNTRAALIFDAVFMFATLLRRQNITQNVPLDCNSTKTWRHSPLYDVINLMKRSDDYHGLTGTVKFDQNGDRRQIDLSIFEVNEGNKLNLGSWTTKQGLVLYDNDPTNFSTIYDHLRVVTTLTKPYVMLRPSTVELEGNDRYEGYAIDLLDELTTMCNFQYSVHIASHAKVGSYDAENGSWTGMIGDILKGEADLAIGDVTITAERETVVDFTIPFMETGISILYKKHAVSSRSFSFAEPFSTDLWLYIIVAGILVSVTLFILGRISHLEWRNPCIHNKAPEYLTNELTLSNCFWFVTGSFMRQCYDIRLRSKATRIVAAAWWMFTLLMVSFYVAKLTAIITNGSVQDRVDFDFRNFEELIENAESKGIKYGAISGGSTANFFKTHARLYPGSAYEQAWNFMRDNDDVMVLNNAEGVQKVLEGGYAFFMEVTSIEYEVGNNCELQQIGDPLDSKTYGIATRKNDPVRHCLSTAILQLKSKLALLKRKWWIDRTSCNLIEGPENEAGPADLKSLWSIFMVTLFGMLIAFLLGTAEAIGHTSHKAAKAKMPVRKALSDELRFFFSFKRVKPSPDKVSNVPPAETTSSTPEEREMVVIG